VDVKLTTRQWSHTKENLSDGVVESAPSKAREYNSNELPAAEEFISMGPPDPARFASGRSMESFYASEIDAAHLVCIDEEFDFYDPSTKQTEVLKMAEVHDNVLHTRSQEKLDWNLRRMLFGDRGDRSQATKAAKSDAPERTCSEDSTGSSSSQQSEDSESEAEHSGSEDESRTPPSVAASPSSAFLQRSKSYFDADNVTNWGTMVAKLVRRRVDGLTGQVFRTMHKRRHTLRLNATQPVQYVLPSVRAKAQFVVDRARHLAKKVEQESVDQFDSTWMEDPSVTIKTLFGQDYIDTLMLLANTARKVVASQPVLVEAQAPCRVFGDIHGQLRDVLILFRAFGFPGDRSGVSFVFNGDFVDRGTHSLEVIGMLFAMKVLMPDSVWLVRGNHEDRGMNERYGFEAECYQVLGRDIGPKTYELIHRAFDELPLACVINDKVLVVHGGLGDGKWTLNDVRAVERPLRERQLASDPMVWNILWSDPIEDDQQADQQGVFGVHPSPRSSTGLFKFGWNVTKTFCAANGLGLIIRSHQSKEGSLGFSLMHDRMLIRVFSARDYEEHGNDGAVILVSELHPSDKLPSPRRGQLIARPQVVRSVTKFYEGAGQGSRRKTKRKSTRRRRGSIE
jgi:diadenosine tetraphosphatase ApaH/serine/threonine PP2A family protein phosphatase